MRFAGRTLAVAVAGYLACAGGAWAMPVRPGATYRASIGQRRAAFKVGPGANTLRFRGTALVGLACPPYGVPPAPPAAVLLISTRASQRAQGASRPPLVRIHRNGSFTGSRQGLFFRGRFTRGGDALVLRIRIKDPGCLPQRPEYTFRLAG